MKTEDTKGVIRNSESENCTTINKINKNKNPNKQTSHRKPMIEQYELKLKPEVNSGTAEAQAVPMRIPKISST